jgi:hypothetical protein
VTTPAQGVPDFIAGYGPQQSDMTSLWSDAAAFFQQRVVLRVSQTTTATTLPSSGATTTIAFDNVIEDPYGGWSASTHKWTPPAGGTGWYLATLTVRVVAAAANGWDLAAIVATPVASYPVAEAAIGSGSGSGVAGSAYVYLVGSQDDVFGQAYTAAATASLATSLTAGQQSTLEVCWVMN